MDGAGPEVGEDALGGTLDRAEHGAAAFDQLGLGAGRRPAPQLLLEIVVEVFVGIVLRCVGREEEELDFVPVAVHPGLDLLGVMNAQVVDNEEDLLAGVLGQPAQVMNSSTLRAPS